MPAGYRKRQSDSSIGSMPPDRFGTSLAPTVLGAKSPAEDANCRENEKFSGAPSETRTPDPLIKSQLLYQLS
jgi:hypothetical protein